MARRIRLHLEGEHAQLGEVPAVDVARLILAVERTVADAAARILGRRPGLTGRKGGSVEAATRFRLVGVRKGSVVPVLELPGVLSGTEGLELNDARLGELALEATMATLGGSDTDPVIAASLARIGDEVGIGTKYDALTLQDYSGTHLLQSQVLDRPRCDHLRSVARRREAVRDDVVVGTLFEADFERLTAQVRTSNREVVQVTFEAGLADAVQEVLRRRTELVGHVHVDARTGEMRRIEAQGIVRTEQLLLSLADARDDYWHHRSVEQLLAERTEQVANDQSALRDDSGDDLDEVDAFLESLGIA